MGQFSVDDAQISSLGGGRLYRVGASSVPFGLSGLDYYSYPRSLLTAPRGLRRKTILTDNVSGLRPIGFGGRKSAIIADPSTAQFSVGDAQIRSFGGRRLYRQGLSQVPFGLSGLDYYSYPKTLLTRGSLFGSGLGQSRILSGGGFSAGDAQINTVVAEPFGQEKVIVESAPAVAAPIIQTQEPVTTIVEDGGFGTRRLTTVQSAGGLRGGNIILRGGPALGLRRVKSRPIVQAPAPVQEVFVDATSGLGAPIGGFGQRQVVAKTVAPAPAPVFVARAPAPVFTTPVVQAPIAAPIVRRRLGEAFLTQAARPLVAARRVATLARPVAISQPAVSVVNQIPPFPGNVQFTLGGTQIIGGPAIAPAPFVTAPRPVVAVQRPVVTAVQRPTVVLQRPAVAVQRPAVVLQRPAVVQRPVVTVQQPVVSQVKTAGFGARRVLERRIPQMVYVDGGSRFPGIDIIGGYRIGDPRYNYARLPISTRRFANLGLSQGSIEAGPILTAPAPVPALLATKGGFGTPVTKSIAQAAPLGIAGIGASAPAQVVTQEEVIGPSGQTEAVVTTVRETAGPSKIGGPVVGGFGGIGALGATGGTKTITQEEVIGPAGDSQIVTTVTKSAPSKIGGAVIGAPLGLTGVGAAPVTKTVTQEEVIGPAGDSQIVTTVTKSAPSKIGGPVIGGLAAVGQTAPTKVVTQEEVIGPSGETEAVVTTVRESVGPSKIGGPVVGGLSGIGALGATGGTKTITQEEVIGPAGDSQVVTTVTETAGAPSKIGGAVISNPLGLTAVGQAPTKVITQEEVVGPAGDSQIITTVQEQSPVVQQEEVVGLGGFGGVSSLTASPLSQEIAQGPIETALSQETLGDSAIISSGSSLLSPLSQTAVDSFGSGQTQLAVDDVLGPSSGSVTTITEQESVLPDGSVGTTITKVTEVNQQPISQQAIADPIVQQSVDAGGFGGGYGGYLPRVSFLSQYPYDVPSRAILRQALTRPVVQEQQQLEQILVR